MGWTRHDLFHSQFDGDSGFDPEIGLVFRLISPDQASIRRIHVLSGKKLNLFLRLSVPGIVSVQLIILFINYLNSSFCTCLPTRFRFCL